jgi:hypothetical protein
MSKFVRRLAVVIVSALAPMAFVALVTPGVSSACDSGSWWDPGGQRVPGPGRADASWL